MLIDRYIISGFNRQTGQMENFQSYQFDRAALDDLESRTKIFSQFACIVAAESLLKSGLYIDAKVTHVSTYDTDVGHFIFDSFKKVTEQPA